MSNFVRIPRDKLETVAKQHAQLGITRHTGEKQDIVDSCMALFPRTDSKSWKFPTRADILGFYAPAYRAAEKPVVAPKSAGRVKTPRTASIAATPPTTAQKSKADYLAELANIPEGFNADGYPIKCSHVQYAALEYARSRRNSAKSSGTTPAPSVNAQVAALLQQSAKLNAQAAELLAK